MEILNLPFMIKLKQSTKTTLLKNKTNLNDE